jgi:hypothetical protein
MPRYALLLLASISVGPALFAQPVRPAVPETYDVQFRYRIHTDRDERIRQFKAMTEFVSKLGFKKDEKPDDDLDIFDPTAELFTGTIPGANGTKLLEQPSVRTVILTPAGQKWPEDAKTPVQVRILLAADHNGTVQRRFHDQAVDQLKLLGFIEAPGYDHAGNSIVRGTIPAGKLPRLLKDLRTLPGGWFASATPKELLPLPLRATLPIRLIEVLPDFPADQSSALVVPPAGKFEPAVRAIVDDAMKQLNPLVVEIVLEERPDTTSRTARTALQRLAEGAFVEGIVGLVATVRVQKAMDLDAIAKSRMVRTIRMPRVGGETARTSDAQPRDFLKVSNLNHLQGRGYLGAGVRGVIFASDFPDYASKLPRTVKFLDLTGEVNPTIMPAPVLRVGSGTAAAVAFHEAAPQADLTLVRIDPAAFHQQLTATKAILGETGFSEGQLARLEEMGIEQDRLAARRRLAIEEYRQAFADLSDDERAIKRRAEATTLFQALRADEVKFKGVVDRFLAIRDGLESIKGANVVVNTLTWECGQPHDGLSELSQLVEARFAIGFRTSAIKAAKGPPPPVWIHAASTALGRTWAGQFLDMDDNGVMEFTPPAKVPAKRWTNELNFLNYTPEGGTPAAAIPAGTQVLVSMQWREPHPQDAILTTEPLLPIKLRLLRQVDPEGKVHSTDDFTEVVRSVNAPARLFITEGGGVYEASFAVTIPAEGVYALRVEGTPVKLKFGLSEAHIGLETRPRLSVEMLDPAQAAKGYVGFESYTNPNAGVGISADSPAAFATGAKGESLNGAGPSVLLKVKPELNAPAVVPGFRGSATAAGFAGGTAACLLELGVRPHDLIRTVGLTPGGNLVLSKEWIDSLPPRKNAVRER